MNRLSTVFQRHVTQRPRFFATLCSIVLLGAVSKSAGFEDRVALWSLVKYSDAIIDGTVVDARPVDNGVWHRIQIHDTVWGETPRDFVDVFVHGPRLPESVVLHSEDRGLMGFRWLSPDGGDFERTLLESTEGISDWAALVSVDPLTFAHDDEERDRMATNIRILATAIREESPGEAVLEEVAALIDDNDASVREVVLRTFNELGTDIPPSVIPDLQRGFEEEADFHYDEHVLRSFFDTVRNKDLPLNEETVCQIVVSHEEINLVNDGIEALDRLKTDDTLSALLTHYTDGTPGERGRIIRALSRFGWDGAVPLCGQAFESDEWDLHVSAIESLGALKSEAATVLLVETVELTEGPLRNMALESLSRQRTCHSFRALRCLMDDEDLLESEERGFINRKLSNRRGRAGRGFKN